MLETFGEELEVAKAAYAADPRTVWTVVDSDDGDGLVVVPGWHHVNRQGYIVCETPFGDEHIEVVDDPQAWIESLSRSLDADEIRSAYRISPELIDALDDFVQRARSNRARGQRHGS
jgi:hypothetical protein